MKKNVITIGHAGLSLAAFLQLLENEEIQILADLRQFPVSRHQSEFNRAKLSVWLRQQGIEYLFLGNGLGNIPEKILHLEREAVQIDANLPEFRAFSHDLGKLLAHLHAPEKVAILGAKAEPFHCPRFYQISPLLQSLGFSIYHLLHNGAKIPNWQLELDLPDMAHVESTQALEMQQSKLQKAYRAHRQMQAVQNVNKRSRFDDKTFSNPEDSEEGSIQSKLQYLQSLNFTKIVAA